MDLLIIFRILLRRKWVLIGIPLVIGIATFFVTGNLPLQYRSTSQLSTGFTTNDKIQVTEENLNLREASVKFSNLIETMRSELVLSMVSYRLLLHDHSSEVTFRNFPNPSITDSLSTEEVDKAIKRLKSHLEEFTVLSPYDPDDQHLLRMLSEKSYLGWQLLDDINIFRVRDTDFVKIQFLSEDPFLSAFVVNTLAEEYIRYENSQNKGFSGQSVDFFAQQMNEKRNVMEEKSKAYDNFLRNNGLVSIGAESEAKLNQISEYELMEQEAENEVQRLELSVQDIKSQIEQSERTSNRTTTNEKVIQIREKINELTQLYRQSGSTDTTLSNAIRKLRYDLQIQMDRLSATEQSNTVVKSTAELQQERQKLELDLRIARQNLSSIRNNLYSLKSSISGYASNEATLQALKRDMDKATEDFNKAEERYSKELDKSKVAETSVRLIIRGQPNGSPESNKRGIIILMSIFGSFAMTGFAVIVIEFMDMRLKTPDQFKKLVKLPLIGTIPMVSLKNLELTSLFGAENNEPDKETFKHFLRKLRYELEKDLAQVYLITSNRKNDGKSFIILSLSYTLSLLKKKVLIIDTNFKNNTLTKVLMPPKNKRIDNKKFLLTSGNINDEDYDEFEEQEMGDDEFINQIVSGTVHKSIYIIGNNKDEASPSEIFAGKDFNKIIEHLKQQFDYIFLEGPSLNDYSDTQELVSYVDKVIPVFSSETSIKQIDRESITYLKRLDGKLLGTILNRVQLQDLKI